MQEPDLYVLKFQIVKKIIKYDIFYRMSVNNVPLFEAKKHLEVHLKEKKANQDWLFDLLFSESATLSTHFPYALSEKGLAKLSSKRFETLKTPIQSEKSVDQSENVYWVTIPSSMQPRLHLEGEQIPLYKKIQDQVKILAQEGFYEPGKVDSSSEAKSRLFVCFGLNQYKSIDRALNKEFIKVVRNFVPPDSLHIEAEGFFWKIPFSYKQSKKAPPYLDKARKAFKKVKMLDPSKGALLRKEIELTEQGKLKPSILDRIPFCKIRNRILKSVAARELTDTMARLAPDNTHYFLTMDDDAISLKGEKGYFRLLDDTILDYLAEGNAFPSVVSFGYNMPQSAGKLSKAATKIDMAVRSAMNSVFPLSCYMPEPGVAFFSGYGSDELKEFMQRATFEPHKPPSRDMESRRLIESLKQESHLKSSDTIFKNIRALITSEPYRMAKASQKMENIVPIDLKKLSVQKNLKELPQNHFKARNFAKNLYFALPDKFKSFTGSSGAIVVPVSEMFKVFDPLQLQKHLSKKYALDEETAFDAAFELYLPYIEALTDENNTPSEMLNHSFLTNGQVQEVLAHGRQSLLNAYKAFQNYSSQHKVQWKNNERAKVEKTAQAACLAIYETLSDIVEKNSFDSF